jgi:hypothetical protein
MDKTNPFIYWLKKIVAFIIDLNIVAILMAIIILPLVIILNRFSYKLNPLFSFIIIGTICNFLYFFKIGFKNHKTFGEATINRGELIIFFSYWAIGILGVIPNNLTMVYVSAYPIVYFIRFIIWRTKP